MTHCPLARCCTHWYCSPLWLIRFELLTPRSSQVCWGQCDLQWDRPSITLRPFHSIPRSFQLCKETFVHSSVYRSQGNLAVGLCSAREARYRWEEHLAWGPAKARAGGHLQSPSFMLCVILLGNANDLLQLDFQVEPRCNICCVAASNRNLRNFLIMIQIVDLSTQIE